MAAEFEKGQHAHLSLVEQVQQEWPESLGDNLRHIRGKYMSQSNLAEELGLDHSQVSRMENGQRNPSRGLIEGVVRTKELPVVEADRLRASAGFRGQANTIFYKEEELLSLNSLLSGPELDETAKERVREILSKVSQMALRLTLSTESAQKDADALGY